MADTYSCPLENSAKHKNVFFQQYPTVPKNPTVPPTDIMASVLGLRTMKKKKLYIINTLIISDNQFNDDYA